MYLARVVTLLALLAGQAHCFKWDIVVAGTKQLEFYHNGTLTHTQAVPEAHMITSLALDPVRGRLLFSDSRPNMTVYSFDLATRALRPVLAVPTYDNFVRVAYDPVSQRMLYQLEYAIYSYSLDAARPSRFAVGDVVSELVDFSNDVAVDSCGGYVYWATDRGITRARLNGSDRVIVVDQRAHERRSMVLDQRTRRIYWTETDDAQNKRVTIESADFDGNDRKTVYTIAENTSFAHSLAVSKDFLYWQNYEQEGIWQLPKDPARGTARRLPALPCDRCWVYHRIATNYKIKEQLHGVKGCSALRALIPSNSSTSNSSSTSSPECAASVCQNYCFAGECSVSAEGEPTCSCEAGYSGERCEVAACQNYCLNGGVCSLSEDNERACRCAAGYQGERCHVPALLTQCVQAVSLLKDLLNADVSSVALSKGVKTACAATVL